MAVALAAINEGIDELPVAFLEQSAFEIRLLHDQRQELVAAS